jgi:hypothetical protein
MIMPPGAPIATGPQGPITQLDVVLVDDRGTLNVLWAVGSGAWQGPAALTAAEFAVPGAVVAMDRQGPGTQLDALVVDATGALEVLWAPADGPWQGPVALTHTKFAHPRAVIALGHQGPGTQLDALLVDANGALNVLWAVDGQPWQGPVAISPPWFAPPGARVTLASQGPGTQLDTLVVDNRGALNVLWAVGGGNWQGPVAITQPGFSRAGAAVATGHQGPGTQLDAFVVDMSGRLNVLWAVGFGNWQGPVAIS